VFGWQQWAAAHRGRYPHPVQAEEATVVGLEVTFAVAVTIADLLPASVEWSARIYVRRPEEVAGELARQMNKVRSQVRHYTDSRSGPRAVDCRPVQEGPGGARAGPHMRAAWTCWQVGHGPLDSIVINDLLSSHGCEGRQR